MWSAVQLFCSIMILRLCLRSNNWMSRWWSRAISFLNRFLSNTTISVIHRLSNFKCSVLVRVLWSNSIMTLIGNLYWVWRTKMRRRRPTLFTSWIRYALLLQYRLMKYSINITHKCRIIWSGYGIIWLIHSNP